MQTLINTTLCGFSLGSSLFAKVLLSGSLVYNSKLVLDDEITVMIKKITKREINKNE